MIIIVVDDWLINTSIILFKDLMESGLIKSDLLTDKDCQQFSKTYRIICQLYYENKDNTNTVQDLIHLTSILPQIIQTKTQSNSMMISSMIQILKAKAKNQPVLQQKIEKAIEHLRKPIKQKLNANLAIELLRKNEVYTIGCIISIRLFNEFIQSAEVDYKSIFQCLGNNLLVNPSLTVELLQLLCTHSQQNSHLTVKAGIVKTIFLNYIPQTMKQKLALYKCIKLIKIIANVEPSILREREKILSLVIFTYEEYIPIVEDICGKCYDANYSAQIDQKNAIQNIDQLYLWSYSSSFCRQILSKNFIGALLQIMKGKKPLTPQVEAKSYAIISNYCKSCEYSNKQLLKVMPKHQQGLLNYIKMCISIVRLDPNSIQLIDWPNLDKAVAASSHAKTMQLHKMLKEMIGKTVQVGTLNNSLKSIFTLQKHADLLGERATRIPKNNSQLEDTLHMINQKQNAGASQFDQDNLKMMKEKAIDSLHTAISKKYKLNINPLINDCQFNNIQLLSKFLQAVELNLMMNQDSVDELNINKILEMIRWMQEHYNGEIIDWGVIIEILGIVFEEEEWTKRIKSLPKDCFWLLQIEELTPKSEQILFSTIENVLKSSSTKKLSMIVGFLGKKLQISLKVKLLKIFKKIFDNIKQQLQKDVDYKLHLMMLSYFIKGWHQEQSEPNYQSINKEFKNFIRPLVDIVVTTYKALPQQHYFLQSCLPYKIHAHSLTKNINPLVNTHGKLAAYLHQNQAKGNSTHLPSDRFNSISTLSPSVILQNLKFLAQNPQMINVPQLQRLLQRITKNKDSYWDLYPYYVDIISLITELIGTQNTSIKPYITDDIVDIITQIQQNQDVQKEEREDLLYDMCDTLEGLQKRGTYIEIQRIRKVVTKITQQQVKEEIIIILNNYKPTEQPQPKVQEVKKQQKTSSPIKKTQSVAHFQSVKQEQKKSSQSELRMQANLQSFAQKQQSRQVQIPKQVAVQSLESLFQSVKIQSATKNLYQVLQMLRRIIDKKEPIHKFNQIYPILSNCTLNEPQKELLGSLLTKFYPMQYEERALTLLLDKQRTTLPKEAFEEMVRAYTHAFKLVRRWRFQSREALDISMVRIKQGYLQDACIVSTYNLKKSASELEYFYAQKYHKILPEVLSKVISEDEVVQFLTLVGTVVKLPQIKQYFIEQKMHTKIMPLNSLFPMSVRVNSSLCYALSTLSFEQANACSEIVMVREPMKVIYECLKSQSKNKAIVEPGVCLIANLSYPNSQLKETLRQRKTVQLLLALFQDNLPNPQDSIFKQLLRGFGNFSMIKLGAEQIIDGHFCDLAVRMAESLDFFVYYDDKKARLMKLLINLISNLANHKIKLQLMHQEKITLLILTMLETTEKNGQLLAGCIDTIDTLCQSPLIELYTIQQKRLLYILMDILKLQEQTSILLKAGRLVSNLSIHGQCVPFILKANIMSVIGNVVVPNLYIGIMTEQQSKRMEGYVLKILTRIHQFKPQINLVLKSGYLDCLVRIIELTDVEDDHLQILFFYSRHLPNFLNKRAFSCLIKTLIKKIDSNVTIGKCIISFKNLLTFSYNRDDDLQVIGNIPQIYEKILKSQFFVDGLFLLVYHLLRSHNLRKTFKKREDKVMQTIEKLGKQQIYIDISKTILFLIYNPFTPLWIPPLCQTHQDEQQFYRTLRDGFKCKLYRADGSHKNAKLDIDDQYNIRIFKYPGGEKKDKYTLNVNHIRDIQIDFRENDELWNHTVFSMMGKSFLQSHVPNRKLCVTIIGSSRWGEVKLINFEFSSEEEKLMFYQCVSHLIYLFKT